MLCFPVLFLSPLPLTLPNRKQMSGKMNLELQLYKELCFEALNGLRIQSPTSLLSFFCIFSLAAFCASVSIRLARTCRAAAYFSPTALISSSRRRMPSMAFCHCRTRSWRSACNRRKSAAVLSSSTCTFYICDARKQIIPTPRLGEKAQLGALAGSTAASWVLPKFPAKEGRLC